jgi:hypothetical protein
MHAEIAQPFGTESVPVLSVFRGLCVLARPAVRRSSMFPPDPGNLVRCNSKTTRAPYLAEHGHRRRALVLAGTPTPPLFVAEWPDFRD